MKKGFTLMEMLIATAIFTLVIISFITVFVTVAGVQARQMSAASVNEESLSLLQRIQYYIALSSLVSSTQDLATSTLILRMPSSTIDPTVISLSNGTAYIQQGGGALQALTSNNVVVSNLSFVRRANPPGHDLVNVSFTVSYNTSNIKQVFVQALQTSVARVSAATFDSGVYPTVSGNGQLGSQSQAWTSVNGVIDFSGTNVGINVLTPQQALEINGGVRLNPSGGAPTCNSTIRGTLWFIPNDGSGPDTLEICAYNASSSLGWQTVFY
jgi:prepilin-type N-terminal cleavage/methylation domain-containing protein